MRIGFLFNHDQIHQVAHSLPIALALIDSGFVGEIVVATTSPRLADEVTRLGGAAIGTRISHVRLQLSPSSKRLARLVGAVAPAAKLLVYRDNAEFFRGLDVLVVAEKTSLALRRLPGMSHLRIVHTRHGAGDRAIGFDRHSAEFDLVLCSGTKIRDRLIREANVPPQKISIVGYPKFDLLPERPCDLNLDRSRPVILYNPHCSPHLSSWYTDGRRVLDFFLEHEEYQLIFAPHVMLFERPFMVSIDRLRVSRPGRIASRYLAAPNIRIDLGSRLCTDMTYTMAADLYLGDVSSQVYEFLYRPRPCLFLNSHQRAWRGDPNFEHWNAGPVIESATELARGLQQALATHADFRPIQQEMIARTFDITDVPSGRRAADALLRFAYGKPATTALAEVA